MSREEKCKKNQQQVKSKISNILIHKTVKEGWGFNFFSKIYSLYHNSISGRNLARRYIRCKSINVYQLFLVFYLYHLLLSDQNVLLLWRKQILRILTDPYFKFISEQLKISIFAKLKITGDKINTQIQFRWNYYICSANLEL